MKVTIRIVKPETNEEKRRIKKGDEVISRVLERMILEYQNREVS